MESYEACDKIWNENAVSLAKNTANFLPLLRLSLFADR